MNWNIRNLTSYKKTLIRYIFYIIKGIRPYIGPKKTCIYPVSCTVYSKKILENKPLYLALPLIIIRLISCNPITVFYWKIRDRIIAFYRKK